MFSLIITSAGSGSRMNLGYNKMLYQVDGKYLFNITISKFLQLPDIAQILLVVSEKDYEIINANVVNDPRIQIVIGGETRQDSIINATKYATSEYVMIHDGARCFIDPQNVLDLMSEIKQNKVAASLAIGEVDSVRKVIDGEVVELLDRDLIYKMQTPQVFNRLILTSCQKKAKNDNVNHTDEVGLLFEYGYRTKIVLGSKNNIKITNPEDLGDLNEFI